MKNLKDIFESLVGKPVAFIIKGSPDPDAIACSFSLLSYYQSIGGEGNLYHYDYVSHSANKTMINVLDIQMQELNNKILPQEKYYIVCDNNDCFIEGLEKVDCILHIDHHKNDSVSFEGKKIPLHQIIETDVGSCSTIITKLLSETDFFISSPNAARAATALAYGIKTDTDNLDAAREKDWGAMKILSQYCNKDLIQKITKSRLSAQTVTVLKAALENEKTEQNWLYAGVGFLQDTYRDSIALVADEIIRRQGIDNVLIYAIIEKAEGSSLQGSIRSIDASFDIDNFVKNFSNNSGGRKFKGGFEISLGFWSTCDNRELLDEFTRTTIEGKLKSILATASINKKKKES